MDIFQKIVNNHNLINELSDILKSKVKSNITHKITPSCIMFFIGDSKGSILSILPNKDESLMQHATSPKYEDIVKECIDMFKIKLNREEQIDKIIKKES